MSKFKSKKLASVEESPTNGTTSLIKRFFFSKKTISVVLFIASLSFAVLVGLQAMGSRKLTNNEVTEFTPVTVSGSAPKIVGTTNILIAGVGGQGHDGADLTDSLMLASIDSDRGQVTLLSIPRDLYVAYPKGYVTIAGRINGLYTLGKNNGEGINLLAQKVSEITGQPIDHYVVIDFSGFKNIVDALGGITVNVPKSIVDTSYPDDNWKYEVFSVQAGVQEFNGSTALKYSRSRHSTSDFDRSERQQIIIKAIKEKAISLGILTNPGKISALYDAVIKNIDTSLTLGDITRYGLALRDIKTNNINVYTLNNSCEGIKCLGGAYLYNPARDYFGGASVLLPENATMSRLSYYDHIERFANLIFRFPSLRYDKLPLVIIYNKGMLNQARALAMNLGKLGFSFDTKNVLLEATGSVTSSHINFYWNKGLKIGIDPESTGIQALKYIEGGIPYSEVARNEYVSTDGPKIEIVLGSDAKSYFNFIAPIYYLPGIAQPEGGTGNTNTSTTIPGVVSGEPAAQTAPKSTQKPTSSTAPKSTQKPTSSTPATKPNTPTPATSNSIKPGEWENF